MFGSLELHGFVYNNTKWNLLKTAFASLLSRGSYKAIWSNTAGKEFWQNGLCPIVILFSFNFIEMYVYFFMFMLAGEKGGPDSFKYTAEAKQSDVKLW